MKFLYTLICIFLFIGCNPKELKTILIPTVKAIYNIYFDDREVDIEAWLSYYIWKLNN